MKILAKLLMGFVAVAMLCGVVGVVGISQLGSMSREITVLSDSTIPTIQLLHQINKEMLAIKVAVRTLVNPLGVDDEVFIKRQKDNIAAARERYGKLIADFDLLPKTAEEQKLWDAVKAAIPPVKAYNDTLAKLADEAVASRDPLERQAIYAKLYEMVAGEQRLAFDNFLTQVDGVIAYDSKHYGKEVPAAAKAAAEVGRYVLVGVTVVSFAVAIMLGVLLGLSISRSLKRAAAVLDKIALGDLSERMESKSKDEFLQVSRSLNTVADNLRSLIETSESLADSLVEGKLGFRADAQGFKGAYAELMGGFNTVVDSLVGFIDSMPNPAMLIDENYEILFMNKAGAAMGNLTGDQLVKARRKCYDFFKTGDCKSQRCACTQAMQIGGPANSETAATPLDKTFDIAYTGVPVRDRAGKIVGAFEVISDQTAIKAAERKMKKIAAFQDVEINRLNQNLQKIALGDLSVDLELGESDAETHDTKLRFETIAAAMKRSIDAIGALVSDANLLAEAAVEGKLATRAEAGKHQGDFRRIVEGVNRTLDLVIGPINETTEIMKRLAEGDLTTAMTGAYKGDFDILKTALNESLESINDILSQVNIAVDQVAEGSIQVSQASQALSQGATEQASSLEEITSSVTEISGQTKQNTESAVQVNGLAKTARSNADQGNKQMQNLVAAMADINSSAEEIKKIVKAIDDISFQINLLALNANVEAARAGKYGKGFAVVAEEVRNLAVRSAGSVKETTRMVDEAIANIARGNELCDVTAKQLSEIVGGAAQVAGLAEEVSAASKEQTLGLEQITQGLNQIDQVTQANTASAEESASASEELSSQAQQLKSMLSRFKLRVGERRLDDGEVLKMLRSELAKRDGQKSRAIAPVGGGQSRPQPAKLGKIGSGRPNPVDVISLDDDNFGKF